MAHSSGYPPVTVPENSGGRQFPSCSSASSCSRVSGHGGSGAGGGASSTGGDVFCGCSEWDCGASCVGLARFLFPLVFGGCGCLRSRPRFCRRLCRPDAEDDEEEEEDAEEEDDDDDDDSDESESSDESSPSDPNEDESSDDDDSDDSEDGDDDDDDDDESDDEADESDDESSSVAAHADSGDVPGGARRPRCVCRRARSFSRAVLRARCAGALRLVPAARCERPALAGRGVLGLGARSSSSSSKHDPESSSIADLRLLLALRVKPPDRIGVRSGSVSSTTHPYSRTVIGNRAGRTARIPSRVSSKPSVRCRCRAAPGRASPLSVPSLMLPRPP